MSFNNYTSLFLYYYVNASSVRFEKHSSCLEDEFTISSKSIKSFYGYIIQNKNGIRFYIY